MRLIGHIQESSHAAAFGDYLFLQGVENDVEREDDGSYSIWAHDEECIEKAVKLLKEFEANPDGAQYQDLEDKARQRREKIEQENAGRPPVTFESRDVVQARRFGMGPITGSMIAFSCVVFVLSSFSSDIESIMSLFIREFQVFSTEYRWNPGQGLSEVRSGQVWRLVTPIFIHFGVLHILFNMMWLRQLGSAMEHIDGKLFFSLFVIITAAASNYAQYLVKGSPVFGGMSGIVFALFGFVWMKSKYDFMSGYAIDPQTVGLMLIWFAICFTGFMPIANTVHSVGLGMGVACGYISAKGFFRRAD